MAYPEYDKTGIALEETHYRFLEGMYLTRLIRFHDVSVYFSRTRRPPDLRNQLEGAGFRAVDEEAWMLYEGRGVPEQKAASDLHVRAVNGAEIDTFVRVFRHATGLPATYAQALLDSYRRPTLKRRITHYLCFLDEEPVGVATVVSSGRFAGIYNVATVGDRRTSVVKSLILEAVSHSSRDDHGILFLQADLEGETEKLFRSVGFRTLFVRSGYVLAEPREA